MELLTSLFDRKEPLTCWPNLSPGQAIAPDFRSRANTSRRAAVGLGAVQAIIWSLTSCTGGFSPSGTAWTAYVDSPDDNRQILAGQGDYWALPEGGETYLLAVAGLLDAFARKTTDADELLLRFRGFRRDLLTFLNAPEAPLNTLDLPRASQTPHLNNSLAGVADCLYFYLKARLKAVKLIYGPPPCTVPLDPKGFPAVIFETAQLTAVGTTASDTDTPTSDFEAFALVVRGFAQLSPNRRSTVIDTLRTLCG